VFFKLGTQQITIGYDTPYDVNSTDIHYLGFNANGAAPDFNGYMAEVHFVDGSALTPSSFGEVDETTGVWKPIAYAGSYGTNGFYLNFSDNSDVTATTLGKDDSGNGNNWTPSGSPGFSVTAGAGNDSLVDTPTQYGDDTGAGGEVRGNYCTLNPLNIKGTVLPSNGNLELLGGSSVNVGVAGTFTLSSGKWYWELIAGSQYNSIGINLASRPVIYPNQAGGGLIYYGLGNGPANNDGVLVINLGAFTADDVIGAALDLDAGTLAYYKNGVSLGTPFTGISGTYYPVFGTIDGPYPLGNVNFGQRPFAYTAPSGFKALVTTNLPEPTVVQGDDYFNTVLYTGNGSTQSITGVGFQPDFVWIKNLTGFNHQLFDVVRGATKRLFSSSTLAESTDAQSLSSFDSDGFSLGSNVGVNDDSQSHVAWNWKANGAGVSNTDGTITKHSLSEYNCGDFHSYLYG
jgi:hypothetical protein